MEENCKQQKARFLSGLSLLITSSAPTGNRTPNLLIKSQLLCQLSYRRWEKGNDTVRVLGIEPRTHGLKGRCSTKLSYTLINGSHFNKKNLKCQYTFSYFIFHSIKIRIRIHSSSDFSHIEEEKRTNKKVVKIVKNNNYVTF
jgi:hypothetical protein